MRTIQERLVQFLFPTKSDNWLSYLRFGLGLQIILYCWSLRSDWNLLFTGNSTGLIGRDLTEAILDVRGAYVPRLGWLVTLGRQLGLNEEIILTATWMSLLFAGCCLLLGLFCRSAAMAGWFLHLCTAKSGELFSYGMDNFTTIGLFYLMISPLPDRYSLDFRIRRLQIKDARRHGFHRRVLQLHLCIIYFFGGFTKSLGIGWWNGTSIWRAMICPPFNVIQPEVILFFKSLLPFLGAAVCLLELGYPIMIWSRRTRGFWLLSIIGMHLAIGFTMGLYLFAFIMIILNVAAFGPNISEVLIFKSLRGNARRLAVAFETFHRRDGPVSYRRRTNQLEY